MKTVPKLFRVRPEASLSVYEVTATSKSASYAGAHVIVAARTSKQARKVAADTDPSPSYRIDWDGATVACIRGVRSPGPARPLAHYDWAE